MQLTGPGKVWLQSMSLPMLAHALSPYLPHTEGTTANGSLQSVAIGGGIEAVAKGLGNLL